MGLLPSRKKAPPEKRKNAFARKNKGVLYSLGGKINSAIISARERGFQNEGGNVAKLRGLLERGKHCGGSKRSCPKRAIMVACGDREKSEKKKKKGEVR